MHPSDSRAQTPAQLITILSKSGIRLFVENGELKFKAPKGTLTEDRKQQIRHFKSELIELLSSATAESIVIPRIERSPQGIPISPNQRRLWLLEQLNDSLAAYNIFSSHTLIGKLDFKALENAFFLAIQRHESLRTLLKQEHHDVVSLAIPIEHWNLHFTDLSCHHEQEATQLANELIDQWINARFDLSRELPIKTFLFKLDDSTHRLLIVVHHIAADGWSMPVFVRDLMKFYVKPETSLAPLALQYQDYASWLNSKLGSENLKGSRRYWQRQLMGASNLNLPYLPSTPKYYSPIGTQKKFKLPIELCQSIQSLSQQLKTTEFTLYFSIFAILLWRYTKQTDFCIGIPSSGRPHKQLEEVVGFFVNTLAIRVAIEPTVSFSEFVPKLWEIVKTATKHELIPVDEIVSDLDINRDSRVPPLFQVLFSFQQFESITKQLGPLEIKSDEVFNSTSKYPITFSLEQSLTGYDVLIEYNTLMFNDNFIYHFFQHYAHLLKGAAENASQALHALTMTSAAELGLLHKDSSRHYPRDSDLFSEFIQKSREIPDAIALVSTTETLTYHQLANRALTLASALSEFGINQGDMVSLRLDRSITAIAVTLAITSLGATYVPIDTRYPLDRVRYICQQCSIKLLISDEETLADLDIAQINLRALSQAATSASLSAPPAQVSAESTAYVMYTSGSTGTPKGVAVSHRNILRLVHGDFLPNSTLSCWLQYAPISFDAATLEIWYPLLTGSTLAVAPPGLLTPTELKQFIQTTSVDSAWFTVALFNQLVDCEPDLFSGMRCVLTGGDALSFSHVKHLQHRYPNLIIMNGYGPTENTTFTTTHIIQAQDIEAGIIPIGRTLAHSSVHVLDEWMQPVGIHIPGELYAGGDGVATGYINNPELTAQAFVTPPLSVNSQSKLYKTGDLVSFDESGLLYFHGRLDQQIKIRGFRIELSEIEYHLTTLKGVKNAVVTALEIAESGKMLVAYIEMDGEYCFDAKQLKSQLSQQLPEYMIPSVFKQLEALPLTSNGKIDKRALPALCETDFQEDYSPPTTHTEKCVAAIWSDILNLKDISITQNFFSLGGHSLLLTKLAMHLQKETDRQIPLSVLFEQQTIAEQAAWLDSNSAESLINIPVLENQEHYALSFAQHRLWFLDQLDPGNTAYNMVFACKLHGAINETHLINSLNLLIDRHSLLKANFIQHEQEPKIVLREKSPYFIATADWSEASNLEEKLSELIHEERDHSFNLALEPLLRVRIIRTTPTQVCLIINIHHIISDGWSTEILIRDWMHAYDALLEQASAQFAPLPVQYTDFASWQRSKLTGNTLEPLLKYWTKQLDGIPDACLLPVDQPRPQKPSFNGAHFPLEIGTEMSDRINQTARALSTTPFVILLSAYAVVISKWCQQQDVVIGIPVAGRTHPDVENIIGFFVNALIMRIRFLDNPSFTELLAHVKATVQKGFEHQELPADILLDQMRQRRRGDISPGAQIGFSMQNVARLDQLQFKHLQAEAIPFLQVTAKYECLLMLEENETGFTGVIEYNSDLFNATTIERLATHFKYSLDALLANSQHPIAALQLEKIAPLANLLKLPDHAQLLPLTHAQQDILFDALTSDQFTQHCLGYWLEIPYKIDVEKWQTAVQALTQQHSLLQARVILSPYAWTDPAYLVIDSNQQASFSFVDASQLEHAGDRINELVRQLVYRRYDLTSDALVNHYLIKLGPEHYLVVLAAHHLILDGACFGIHAQALCDHYEKLLSPLPSIQMESSPAAALFNDYITFNRTVFDSSNTLSFWREKLKTTQPLSLPVTHSTDEGLAESSYPLMKESWRAIKSYCRKNSTTPSRFFKAIFALTIAQYARPDEDFYFEEIVAGREGKHNHALGCYFHALPVYFPRALLAPSTLITNILNYIKEDGRSSAPHKFMSRSGLNQVAGLNRPRIMFNYYHFLPTISLAGTSLFSQQCEPEWEGPLQCVVAPRDDYAVITTKYSRRYFSDVNFSARLAHIVEQIISDKGIKLGQIDWLLPHEKDRYLPVTNEIQTAFSSQNPLICKLRAVVNSRPDDIAIIRGHTQWSYKTFWDATQIICSLIQDADVTPGQNVAICLPRTQWAIACIAACAYTGVAYIPIDNQYPCERINYILQDSNAKLLLTDEDTLKKLANISPDSLPILTVGHSLFKFNNRETAKEFYHPTTAAYCIYTSGSTGQPKGARVNWRGLENLLNWYQTTTKLKAGSATLLLSSLGFDLTQKNIFISLMNGGKLVLPTDDKLIDHKEINPLVHQHQIRHINCAPSAFYALVENCAPHEFALLASLQTVVLGGEPIALERLSAFRASNHCHCTFINSYGPTECTDVVSYFEIPASMQEAVVPIGRAVPGNELWVLNEFLQPLPPGAVGELYIGGLQVGDGYWGRAELTQSRFLSTTLSKSRLYKTGDLVRWRKDGTLDYIGRNDFQVKLRGLRIELGEIESALNKHIQVNDSVVVLRNEQLIGYILTDNDKLATELDWRTYLRTFVPDYMLPSHIVTLSEWPLNPNGKLDRSALPEPGLNATVRYVAPANEIEFKLVEIWEQTLNRSSVGVTDNFFDLGGNSLIATRTIAKIRQAFDIDIPLRALFELHTIVEIAEFIHATRWATQHSSPRQADRHEKTNREEGLI